MKAAIVAGGFVEDGFTLNYIREQKFDVLYAVDSGLEFFHRTGLRPDFIVGDFDSVEPRVLAQYGVGNYDATKAREGVSDYEALALGGTAGKKDGRPDLELLNPVKDDTDSQHALKMALDLGCGEIHLLGATGSRIDHMLGNLQLLGFCLQRGVKGFLVDPHNRIRLIDRTTRIPREQQFGSYVSLLPFTPQVTGITLTGFQYPLTDHTMSSYYLQGASPVSGISNEILAEEGTVALNGGILVLVEAKD